MKISEGEKVPKLQKACSRVGAGVYLHKSAISKWCSTESKQLTKLMIKMIPDKLRLNKHPPNDAEKYRRLSLQKYAKLSDVGLHFEAGCLIDSWVARFLLRPVFRKLWGYPLGPILTSLRHTWSDVRDCLEDVSNKFAQDVRNSRAALQYTVNT